MSIAFLCFYFAKGKEEQHINKFLSCRRRKYTRESLSFFCLFYTIIVPFPPLTLSAPSKQASRREPEFWLPTNTLIQYWSMHRIYALKIYIGASQTFNQFRKTWKRIFSIFIPDTLSRIIDKKFLCFSSFFIDKQLQVYLTGVMPLSGHNKNIYFQIYT